MRQNQTYFIDYNNGQYLFDRCLNAIFFVLKILFKAIIYFPLLVTGYLVTMHVLEKGDHAFAWIGLTLLFTFILYAFIYFLKGILIALKSKRNFLWIPIFILCVGYTCIAPAIIMFHMIQQFMFELSKEHGIALTWIFCIAFAGFVYGKYQFLINNAPKFIAAIYQAGINLVLH